MTRKTNKKSLLRKIFALVGCLVILATVVDLVRWAKDDPFSCDSKEVKSLANNLSSQLLQKDMVILDKASGIVKDFLKENGLKPSESDKNSPWFSMETIVQISKYPPSMWFFMDPDIQKGVKVRQKFDTLGISDKNVKVEDIVPFKGEKQEGTEKQCRALVKLSTGHDLTLFYIIEQAGSEILLKGRFENK